MRRLFHSPSGRVAAASAINQLAPVLLLPLVTLLYSVEAIAVFQVALSIAIVMQVLVSLGIEYKVPGSTSEASLRLLCKRACWSSSVFLALATGACIYGFVSRASWSQLVLSAAMLAFSFAAFAVANALASRKQQHRLLILSNYVSAAIVVIGQVGYGVFQDDVFGLVLSLSIGRLVAAVISFVASTKLHFLIPVNSEKAPAREASWSWVAAFLLSTLSLQMPIMFAGVYLGELETATVAFALRIVSAPAGLLGAGLAQGFIFDASKQIQTAPDKLMPFVHSAQARLLKLSLWLGGILAVGGPLAVMFLFDSRWHDAAWMIAALSLPFTLQTVNRVLTPVFAMIGRSTWLFVAQAARSALLAVGLCLTVLLGSAEIGIVITVGLVSVAFQLSFGRVLGSALSKWDEER